MLGPESLPKRPGPGGLETTTRSSSAPSAPSDLTLMPPSARWLPLCCRSGPRTPGMPPRVSGPAFMSTRPPPWDFNPSSLRRAAAPALQGQGATPPGARPRACGGPATKSTHCLPCFAAHCCSRAAWRCLSYPEATWAAAEQLWPLLPGTGHKTPGPSPSAAWPGPGARAGGPGRRDLLALVGLEASESQRYTRL